MKTYLIPPSFKEVSKDDFYQSKFITNPKFDSNYSVDTSTEPYTGIYKLKTNNKLVGITLSSWIIKGVKTNTKYFINQNI